MSVRPAAVLASAVALAATLWLLACDDGGGGGDGDVDSDVDSDTDTDADTDSDSDSGGGCAELAEECFPLSGVGCCDLTHVCAGDGSGGGHRCYAPCTLAACDYGTEEGSCVSVAALSLAFCQPVEGDAAPADCSAQATGCADEFGNSSDTICMPSGGETYCLPTCTPVPSGCDETTHFCSPLESGSGGVCVPLT